MLVRVDSLRIGGGASPARSSAADATASYELCQPYARTAEHWAIVVRVEIPEIADLGILRRRQRDSLFKTWRGSTDEWRTLSPRGRIEARYVLEVYSTSADEQEREARFAFTIVALIFGLAAFAVAVLTYFAALVPTSQVALDTTGMAVVASSFNPSWLLDVGT